MNLLFMYIPIFILRSLKGSENVGMKCKFSNIHE